MKTAREILAEADRRDPNYFEVLGTDSLEDANETFPPRFKEYRRRWYENPRDHVVGEFPLHVDIESSYSCNLRCVMCQIDFKSPDQGMMKWDTFERVIGECGKYQVPSIKLNFRGEPLLHPKVVDMVRAAKEHGVMEVQFNTNGVLLNEGKINGLIDAGLDRIKFSLDGATPEVFDSIRIGTNYKVVSKNIHDFVAIRNRRGLKRPSITVQMVYMKETEEDLVKFVETWRHVANRVGIGRYRNPRGHLDADASRVEDFPTKVIPCPQLWQRLLVTYDGKVLMCCGDHHARSPLGHLKERTLHEIWHGPALEAVRRAHLEGRSDEIEACRPCEINKIVDRPVVAGSYA